jgi:hypothetical protein
LGEEVRVRAAKASSSAVPQSGELRRGQHAVVAGDQAVVPDGGAEIGGLRVDDDGFRAAASGPCLARTIRAISAKEILSGPPMLTMPFSGAASATPATSAATSAAAIGWIRASGTLTSDPTVSVAVMPSANSWNCVARTIE